jgi:D-3-phosphoglycerate dehydrogenase
MPLEWLREMHRGWELSRRTVGIIGYGHTGKQFAKKLLGFDVKVLCYDIIPNLGDENAQQVSLEELMQKAEIISLHTPETPATIGMLNASFIQKMKHPFWLINTARGSAVDTDALLKGLKENKVRGAGLDVLAFESKAFTEVQVQDNKASFNALLKNEKMVLSPHIGGWTYESHQRLAEVILEKFKAQFHS